MGRRGIVKGRKRFAPWLGGGRSATILYQTKFDWFGF
ncbi:hypothetical protein swp_3824 [Shewanella piezotolerans WP3]|uniref:Uncharacterized protein n=1 Tax=Shewanella piezotolerans (strain WP3 / JCM 13877) TaxID=225849 RepID=B8CQN6_SHEPW|nr:hypothetical protein swp_3824 [Shewanella piezotolerans WP3]